jgi:hypothetical protein
MDSRLLLAIILVASASALPYALAEEAAFASRGLTLAGDVTVSGPGEALFVPRGSQGLAWEGFAKSVVIERTYSNATRFLGDVEYVGDNPRDVFHTDVQTYGPSRLGSLETRMHATLLARALGSPFETTGATRGIVDAHAEEDPVIGAEDEESVDVSLTQSVNYVVADELDGTFVNLTSGRATYELRGTLTLQLYDVDYAVRTDSGDVAHRTGHYATGELGPVERHRYEIHRITLTDAVVVVVAPDAATLFARDPVVTFDGSVLAEEGEGTLHLGASAFTADGATEEYRGSGTLVLRPAGEFLTVGTQASGARGGALAGAAPMPAYVLAAAGALLVLVVAVVALALRRRAPEASLDAALLAMEERRWEDALAHLDRIVAQSPMDPMLLLDRAICYEETGRLEEARADYEAALIEAPGNAEAHYYYARVLARLRMSTACLAHLSRALALDDRLRELARREAAFSGFRDHPQFLSYLGE